MISSPVSLSNSKRETGFVSYWEKTWSIAFIAALLRIEQFQERIEALITGEIIVINKSAHTGKEIKDLLSSPCV